MEDQVSTVSAEDMATVTAVAAPANVVDAAIKEALDALQARVEDVGVKAARSRGWCDEFQQVMDEMFPDGPVDKTPCPECTQYWYRRENFVPFRDAEGTDCKGHAWRSEDGYDREGYDLAGWNREGVNRLGERKDDPARYRFSPAGFDIDGYNPEGFNRNGRTRDQQERYQRYAQEPDGLWLDIDGYNSGGYNRQGNYDRSHDRSYD